MSTKITLPAILNPISRRKDKSVKLSLETRELGHDEILTLMSLEGSEGWIAFAPNAEQLEIPDTPAELDTKSPSERLKAVLFILWKQQQSKGKYAAPFETFRLEHMDKIIEYVKKKLD